MIETNNPEINVDELMDKVREEVAMRHHPVLASPTISSNMSSVDFSKIEALVNTAEFRSHVRTKWPEKLNRFPFNISKKFQNLLLKVIELLFIDQREVNFNLLQALRESVLFNRQLNEQITTLKAQVSTMDNQLSAIDQRVGTLDNQLSAIDQRVGTLDNQLSAIDQRVGTLDNQLSAIDQRVGTLDNQLSAIDQRVGTLDNQLSAIDQRVGTLDNQVSAIDQRVGAMDNQVSAIDQRVGAMDNQVSAIDQRVGAMDKLVQQVASSYTEAKSVQSLPSFLEVTEASYINSAISLSVLPIEEHYKHNKKDLFYYLFENVFYNSDAVKEKQKFYVQFIDTNLSKSYRFLDAGCGRGEFIKNLTESNFNCIGIDLNNLEVSMLKERGFDVVCSDILDFLENSEETYSGISALQVIEHLNIEDIHKFLSSAFNKILLNGVFIVETVNPHSLYALSNFYQDQTHIKPLPPEALKFLLEWYGFKEVKIIYSSPIPEASRVFQDKRMNYQDYALVGYKL